MTPTEAGLNSSSKFNAGASFVSSFAAVLLLNILFSKDMEIYLHGTNLYLKSVLSSLVKMCLIANLKISNHNSSEYNHSLIMLLSNRRINYYDFVHLRQ